MHPPASEEESAGKEACVSSSIRNSRYQCILVSQSKLEQPSLTVSGAIAPQPGLILKIHWAILQTYPRFPTFFTMKRAMINFQALTDYVCIQWNREGLRRRGTKLGYLRFF